MLPSVADVQPDKTDVASKSALIEFASVPAVGHDAPLALIVVVPFAVDVVTQANLFINAAKLSAVAPACLWLPVLLG